MCMCTVVGDGKWVSGCFLSGLMVVVGGGPAV